MAFLLMNPLYAMPWTIQNRIGASRGISPFSSGLSWKRYMFENMILRWFTWKRNRYQNDYNSFKSTRSIWKRIIMKALESSNSMSWFIWKQDSFKTRFRTDSPESGTMRIHNYCIEYACYTWKHGIIIICYDENVRMYHFSIHYHSIIACYENSFWPGSPESKQGVPLWVSRVSVQRGGKFGEPP